jgi:hypothetical protein
VRPEPSVRDEAIAMTSKNPSGSVSGDPPRFRSSARPSQTLSTGARGPFGGIHWSVYVVAMAGRSTARSYERLNITLPRETVGLLDRVTTKGARSRFINDAIRERVASVGKGKLRRQLEEGYASRFARDLKMVEEWVAVDEQTWEHAERRRRVRK